MFLLQPVVGMYAVCELSSMATPQVPAGTPDVMGEEKAKTKGKRTPGTGGETDLWKSKDGKPTKRATGRWAQGQGKPQGIGSRWRGWYVGDDGKPHTKDFRTEAEAEAWFNAERGKVVTNVWVSPSVGVEH
ncbi:hypothetical protein M2272_005624 [Mycobacterium frederiksbergense]|uniref:AP2/ERF domain-containing protein n=1 Tax=Mycolicibacterium frederiksbergense TaxID=117567 RepID=A0ABT6L7S6_9MYCO|nr:hypothetical protein [Mycolicibacterium frederiksbergense]MDH6198960.1 hypothetical protein [Mycolicibacterium frederiksbergense]